MLVDTEPSHFAATTGALAEVGVQLEQDCYVANMKHGHPSSRLAGAACIDGVDAVFAELAESYGMAIVTTSKRGDLDAIHSDRPLGETHAFRACQRRLPARKSVKLQIPADILP